MQVRLVIVGGRASKGAVPLELPAIVGRSQAAALTIAHPLVSRQHCMIFEANGQAMVRDLESLNGTFIGREKISESPLLPGALLTVGPLTFRVDYAGAPEAPVVVAQGPWAGTAERPAAEDVDPWESGGGEMADDVFQFLDDLPTTPKKPPTQAPAPGKPPEQEAPLALPPKRVPPKSD